MTQPMTLTEKLAKRAHEAREKAMMLPDGFEREQLLQVAHECEAAIQMNATISKPTAKNNLVGPRLRPIMASNFFSIGYSVFVLGDPI